jgi:hypothetical protein
MVKILPKFFSGSRKNIEFDRLIRAIPKRAPIGGVAKVNRTMIVRAALTRILVKFAEDEQKILEVDASLAAHIGDGTVSGVVAVSHLFAWFVITNSMSPYLAQYGPINVGPYMDKVMRAYIWPN